MESSLTAEDVSKAVVDACEDRLGTVSGVEDGVTSVEPENNVPSGTPPGVDGVTVVREAGPAGPLSRAGQFYLCAKGEDRP